MVKQTQKDVLDIFIASGSDLSELLTPDREVIGFQALRDLDMESMDFLGDDLDPINDDLCQVTTTPADVFESVTEATEVIVDGEVVFDPTETSYDTLDFSSETLSSSNTDYFFTSSPEIEVAEIEQETDANIPVSPMLKMDLKNKIKLRRMAQGKEEIGDLFKNPEPERLTEEEEEKRRIRRHKNKMAAQKCRSKKRKLADTLEEQTEKLEEKREKLTNEILKLQEERDHLAEIIAVHSAVCPEMAQHVCPNMAQHVCGND